jgi:transcription initiation factor TFIID subunit 2
LQTDSVRSVAPRAHAFPHLFVIAFFVCLQEDAYAGLSVFCTHLLHDETIIDQTLTSRLVLADAAARQWLGNYIPIR